jgi:Acetyltransferase (GNAT) domain
MVAQLSQVRMQRPCDAADHTFALLHFPIDLGGNLMLRLARPHERDALVEFNTRIFDERITLWTSDLLSGGHPTVQATDFTIVEDTHRCKIVSSMCLISQTWAYDGIPFKVGRVELVATEPEYRRRGLIRKQFQIVHAQSAAKGELMQVITGVDWFYRQFGYEMGVKLRGNRCLDALHFPSLPQGETEPYQLRSAQAGDHPFIRDVYDRNVSRLLYAARRSPEEWDYEFGGRSLGNTRRREWLIVEDRQGQRVGYVQYLPCLASPKLPMFRIYQIELVSGVSYLNAMPSLLRGLWTKAQALVANGDLQCKNLQGLELALERDHPAYQALPKDSFRELKPSPWYIRVPDMIGFLRRIQPALEKHLLGTVVEGHSGQLNLSFYRDGIQLGFECGRITSIESWQPGDVSQGDARFPFYSFWQLLCGWRRFSELRDNFADCWGTHEAAVLLDNLFPPFHGKVWVLA